MNKHGAKSETQEELCANSPIQIVTCEHYKTHPSQLLGCFWQGQRGSLAAPAQQEQALQGSRTGVTLDARSWPGTSSLSLPCNAVWLKGALWIPGDAHLLPDIRGTVVTHRSLCGQQVPCSCPPLCRDSPALPGIISAWSPSDAPILLFLAVTSP